MFKCRSAWQSYATLAALTLVSFSLIGGCNPDKAATSNGETTPEAKKSVKAAEPALNPKTGKPIKLAGIIFQEDQFFKLVKTGMTQGAAELGATIDVQCSSNKTDKEISLVNTMAGGADAIVISPLSKDSSVAALKGANDKGVKIVCWNTGIAADFPVTTIESDQGDLGAQSGAAAVKYINEKLGGKAKIAILAFKSQVPEQSDGRSNGFKGEVTKLPGVTIVAEQDAWMADQAVKKVGDMLTANPDIDIIWAANEGGTTGAVMAIKNARKAGKIVVFGTDTSDQLIGFLKSNDNILQAITGQKPVDIGKMAVDSAIKAIKGEKVEKKVLLKGTILDRSNPTGIADYEKQLAEWMKG